MKHRFAVHILHGGDPDSERVYRWHIEKRRAANASLGLGMDRGKTGQGDYVRSLERLAASMQANGFHHSGRIPVDPSGEPLGGAHRMACALALDIPSVPVTRERIRVWAPAWGEDWFVENGMAAEDLARVRADMEALRAH